MIWNRKKKIIMIVPVKFIADIFCVDALDEAMRFAKKHHVFVNFRLGFCEIMLWEFSDTDKILYNYNRLQERGQIDDQIEYLN